MKVSTFHIYKFIADTVTARLCDRSALPDNMKNSWFFNSYQDNASCLAGRIFHPTMYYIYI